MIYLNPHASTHLYFFAVVVSPHGMRGKLTGCCPGDLVKQVYLRLL